MVSDRSQSQLRCPADPSSVVQRPARGVQLAGRDWTQLAVAPALGVRGRLAHRYADMWRRPCFPEPEARGSPRGPCVCVLAYVPLCSPLFSDNAGTWKTVLGQVRPLWSSSLFILQWDTRWSMDGCFFCFVFLCKNCQKKHFFLFLSLNTEPISSSPYVLLWF